MRELLDRFATRRLLGLDLADATLADVAACLAQRPPHSPFSYVVTPNADHFVRFGRHPGQLTGLYQGAGALVLDSRVVRRLALLIGLAPPPVVTGSDLCELLFGRWIAADEPVTVVGTTPASVASLRQAYGLSRVAHFAPPFGFETDPGMVEQCVRFVAAHPARFVFLACGAPRQELLAFRIAESGTATGVGLCIGAAIDQVGGLERRAPAWLRRLGLEWSWRILREPKRLGLRYLRDLEILPALLAERVRFGTRHGNAERRPPGS